ncbi:hypothetical protein [Kocuria rosea]|uniref:hypothetical protein n=1 Tax=Kocuria rosea TaxID=1275 RepID=UPI002B24E385|nr:hypothetical protein [Kocuria rosea]MEB2528819.1 hypothetical protein [Kocuria rosea]MEB2619360.1 hypothetical protein [Kocuria rosea]
MRTITITDAVEAAARAQYERAAHPGAPRWEDCTETDRAAYRHAVRPHVEAAAPFIAARSLQDAATAFATTRPTEAARRSLEYPVVELQAMAYRHTATQRSTTQTHTLTAPAATTTQATDRSTGTGALRRARSILSAFGPARTPSAA